MSRIVRFRPEITTDIAEAMEWYAAQRTGLEAAFLDDLQATLTAIERNPFQYQVIEREIRRASLKRFPYNVIYRVLDQELVIAACLHGRRNPAHWRERF